MRDPLRISIPLFRTAIENSGSNHHCLEVAFRICMEKSKQRPAPTSRSRRNGQRDALASNTRAMPTFLEINSARRLDYLYPFPCFLSLVSTAGGTHLSCKGGKLLP